MEITKKRCAIYTRKSTDEGLDKEFNSLEAQRESAENKIKSQKHEGWEIIPDHYDDGGISGGTMERPALQRLLQDIKDGKVDMVVVYKIDRLSRSLFDFLGMVRFFDEHNVSFVSVTQDLNTSSAMGRLVLNILQSFAQFEREIASERIKDKIALSKKRGMWMGGSVPIGYDSEDAKLQVNESEAAIVRFIFDEFIETASTTEIVKKLKARGDKTKERTSRRGVVKPAKHFTKQAVYKILNNKTYIGQIEHKTVGEVYEGQHQPIVDMKKWNQAQAILSGNKLQKVNYSIGERPYLLRGIIEGPDGYAMTPATQKKGNRRYRYYVNSKANKTYTEDCTLRSVSAPLLEEVVMSQAKRMLTSTEWINRMLKNKDEDDDSDALDVRAALENFEVLWEALFPAEQARIIQLIIGHITLYPNKLIIQFNPPGMASVLHEMLPDLTFDRDQKPETYEPLVMNIPIDFINRRNRKIIVTPDGKDISKSYLPKHDSALVKALVRAYQWEEMIEKGDAASIAEIANQEKMDRGYVASVMRLTSLAPDITTAILNGRQPQTLQLASIIRTNLPYCWNEQREMLGFETAGHAA
ncbi:MAG: recombinase family protein [Rhodospirillales bacterium]|nr:recombinase family protein [Rhodospirillales bacterium]